MTTVDRGLDPAPSAFEGERLLAPNPKPAGPRRRRRGGLAPYALLGPAIVILALITGWPLIQLIITSFQQFGRAQVFGAPPEWVWFENYVNVLTDPVFYDVLVRTLVFSAACVVVTMLLGTLVALMMVRLPKPFRMLLSVGMLLAWAMPALTATVVWQWLFDSQYGLVNWILVRLGFDDYQGHSWLSRPISFFMVAAIIVVWMGVPFIAFTLYAGMTQIPRDVVEAASIDGAGAWQRFRDVTVPMLKPILLILTALSVLWDFRVFTQIYVLQRAGGINRETNVLGVYAYRISIGENRFDVGAAVAIVMVLITILLTLVYLRQMVRQEEL